MDERHFFWPVYPRLGMPMSFRSIFLDGNQIRDAAIYRNHFAVSFGYPVANMN